MRYHSHVDGVPLLQIDSNMWQAIGTNELIQLWVLHVVMKLYIASLPPIRAGGQVYNLQDTMTINSPIVKKKLGVPV